MNIKGRVLNILNKNDVSKELTKDVLLRISLEKDFQSYDVNHRNIFLMQSLLLNNGYKSELKNVIEALEMLKS